MAGAGVSRGRFSVFARSRLGRAGDCDGEPIASYGGTISVSRHRTELPPRRNCRTIPTHFRDDAVRQPRPGERSVRRPLRYTLKARSLRLRRRGEGGCSNAVWGGTIPPPPSCMNPLHDANANRTPTSDRTRNRMLELYARTPPTIDKSSLPGRETVDSRKPISRAGAVEEFFRRIVRSSVVLGNSRSAFVTPGVAAVVVPCFVFAPVSSARRHRENRSARRPHLERRFNPAHRHFQLGEFSRVVGQASGVAIHLRLAE